MKETRVFSFSVDELKEILINHIEKEYKTKLRGDAIKTHLRFRNFNSETLMNVVYFADVNLEERS